MVGHFFSRHSVHCIIFVNSFQFINNDVSDMHSLLFTVLAQILGFRMIQS